MNFRPFLSRGGTRLKVRDLRSDRRVVLPLLAGTTVTLLILGCTRTTTTHRSVLFEEPTISQGAYIEEEDPVLLNELAEALDAITIKPPLEHESTLEASKTEAIERAAIDDPTPLSWAVSAGMVAGQDIPPDSAQLIALPKMSDLEIAELVDLISLRLGAAFGYVEARTFSDAMPSLPPGIAMDRVLTRPVDGKTHAIVLGHRRYISQLPRLWVFGIIIEGENPLTVNADTTGLGEMVTQSIASLEANRSGITVRDLDTKLIQLSYTDAPTAVKLLKALGVTAYDDPGLLPAEIDYNVLPYVLAIPDPSDAAVGLIGKAEMGKGTFGLSLSPSSASELSSSTIASPMTQLMVMYHPAQPEQFSRVKTLLDEHIDRPARQIFVEGMVLEISEAGLEDLGIEWQLDGTTMLFTGGSLAAGGLSDTLAIGIDNFLNPNGDNWMGTFDLRALIREGKAEVLSRPSVLTLNNRQATIRVGTDIPIVTSQEGISGSSNKLSFSFSYLPTGILLNIRPRINEQGSEVSLLIDTIVSDTVRNADLEIRSSDGEILATAPTVSQRRVQTYARIRNNTPFIIGGLVSREYAEVLDKVPFLGDLPLLGGLFRATRQESTKREVIIVLTPYVLPENRSLLRALPKDDEQFDSFGNDLFRDSYRIRQEDVFDLTFLHENQRLKRYRDLAKEVIGRNFTMAQTPPFDEFAQDRIPGEAVLVTRMVYEVVKRLDLAREIDVPRIIYMEGEQTGGFNVRFLEETMAQFADGRDSRRFFQRMRGKALAMTYTLDRLSMQEGRLATEPIPQLSVIDCPDRDTWKRLLWEMNQPTPDGQLQFTILINSEADLLRLRRAIVLKRILILNGGEAEMKLSNFNVGTVLLMPNLQNSQVHVADADVARLFFATELYYAALIQRLENALNAIDAALRDPALGMPDLTQKLENGDDDDDEFDEDLEL